MQAEIGNNSIVNNLYGYRLVLPIILLSTSFLIVTSSQSFNIWTYPESYQPNQWTSVQLLDTFKNHIILNASVPIEVDIRTIWNNITYAKYSGTYINFWFNDSQGCNSYVGLIKAQNRNLSYTIYPNVTAIHSPTTYLTGYCNTTSSDSKQFIDMYAPIAHENILVEQGIIGKNFTNEYQYALLGRELAWNQ